MPSHNIPKDLMDAYGNWLKTPKDEDARKLRQNILAHIFRMYGVQKVIDLPPLKAEQLAMAIGFYQKPLAQHGEEPTTAPRPSTIQEARARLQEHRLQTLRLEDDADARGELWTCVAAYWADETLISIQQGRHGEDWSERFENRNAGALMYLKPAYLIGNMAEARAEAVRLFHGRGLQKLTLTTTQKKEDK